MRFPKKSFLVAVAAGWLAAGVRVSLASAVCTAMNPAVSNLNESQDTIWSPLSYFTVYCSFTTGPTAYKLTSITGKLQNTDDIAHTVEVDLYSDNTGVAGTHLETLNIGTAPVSNGATDVVFTASGSTTLAPNTTYWVSFHALEATHHPDGYIFMLATLSSNQTSLVGWTIGDYTRRDGDNFADVSPILFSVSVACPPVDCVVSAWSPWSSCSKTCGGGEQTRTRVVLVSPSNGGASCPNLVETQACNQQPCPVDCVVSAWSDWSACSTTCGGGTQTRTRSVVTSPAFGGAACPNLVETQPCNQQPCPVDCVVSDWGPWSACSAMCGGGTQTRTRTVVTPAAFGGAPCPVQLVQTQSCNQQPCPVDCVVSAWSPWSACSATCGGGTQTRTRSVVTSPANGGKACPNLVETQSCNQQPCGPTVTGWRSVRTHTGLGALSIVLNSTATPAGGITSETRRDGIQLVEVDLSSPASGLNNPTGIVVSGVAHNSAGISLAPVNYAPQATVSLANSGNTLRIAFSSSGLPDETCYYISVASVVPGLSGDMDCYVIGLAGDVDQNGSITSNDEAVVKARVTKPVTGDDVRMDLVPEGKITTSDAAFAKSRLGKYVICGF